MNIAINLERLKNDLEALGRIGRDPNGGITRPSFSKADLEARRLLKEKIEDSGLVFRQDGAGNIFGLTERSGKFVLAGSHIDSVVNGGMFDGPVGVLAALECLRRIKEEGFRLLKPVGMAAFSDEEGNLVGDFLGSRAFIGQIHRELLENSLTTFGRSLGDILAGTEFTVQSILEAHRDRPEIESYLELHIEQGAVLDTEEIPLGIVDRIAGKHLRLCAFAGKADHAGTTPLELRRDAFLATADFALKSTQLVATRHYGSMVTIGKVSVRPGSFSVVPGHTEFTLDCRSASEETLDLMERELLELAEDIASTRGLRFGAQVIDKTEPVSVSPRILQTLREECETLGHPFMMMTSGAGHDAQILSAVADVGMIFIPSVDGASHSPEESIRWEDLEKGANLLLRTLIRLAT